MPLLLLGAFLVAGTAATPDIRVPPAIVVHPVKSNIYRPDDEITLECRATGTPTPTYYWTKNGLTLNENVEKITRLADGTIKIIGASSLDEGRYQCFAENHHGIAMSLVSDQRRAIMPESDKTIRDVTVTLGQPLTIQRIKARWYPKPSFEWETGLELDSAPVKLQTNSRVQINSETGDLHFAYALKEDQLSNNKIYKCSVINAHLDIRAGGSYTRVTVLEDPKGLQEFPPRIGFSTPSPYIALERHNISLRCFYNGNPIPEITWRKVGGNLPAARIIRINHNSELIIRNVEPSDEGDYVCIGRNRLGSHETNIHVDVQAAPVFRQTTNVPRDLNLTVGDSATLFCGTHAEPEAQTQWFQNGKKLDPNNLPERFRLSNNNRNLTISNVCRDCGDDRSDLQVIQCNSSNEHGYEFAAGYINVLKRTELLSEPKVDEQVTNDEGRRFEFDCSATSDDSTPVTTQWYIVRSDPDGTEFETVVPSQPPRRWVSSSNGSLILDLPANDTDGWQMFGGRYRCRATNGYSKVEKNVDIDVVDVVTVPPPARIAKSGLEDWWWLFIVIVIIFLLLLLILCCVVYLQRNRGDTYPVDEKERKNGNNPEKELLESDFQNYNRPSDATVTKGSRSGSLASLDNDDVASVDDYGDADVGRFTEDGSFVGGVYGTATTDRKNRGRAGSRTDI